LRALRAFAEPSRAPSSFATHAATADGEKWREPGLLLAMPRHSTAVDDGFLSASEIAGLRLEADLVLLSACNTGAGDGGVASEWLSGLAPAFVHAGSGSLLVSHWNVDSEAGQRIVTGLFELARDAHGLRHSEALRRTMLRMLSDPARPRWSHPYYWAAFQMVGDVLSARSP
jgi:CHAT domain-containing protein